MYIHVLHTDLIHTLLHNLLPDTRLGSNAPMVMGEGLGLDSADFVGVGVASEDGCGLSEGV